MEKYNNRNMPTIIRQEKQYLDAIKDENINLKTIFSNYCDIVELIFEKFKNDQDSEKFSIGMTRFIKAITCKLFENVLDKINFDKKVDFLKRLYEKCQNHFKEQAKDYYEILTCIVIAVEK